MTRKDQPIWALRAGKPQFKQRSAVVAADADLAVVQVHDRAHDRQPQAARVPRFCPRRVYPVEAVEQFVQVLRINRRPGVVDADPAVPRFISSQQPDRRPRLGAVAPPPFESLRSQSIKFVHHHKGADQISWLGDRDSVTCLSSVNSLRSLTSESTLPPLLLFAQSALFSSLSQQKQPQNLKTLWLFSWLGDRDSNPD